MPKSSDYRLWRGELDGDPHDGDPSMPVAGFWRIQGAKTKPDYPVSIYYAADEGAGNPSSLVMQIGRQQPTTGEAHLDYQEFITGTFAKCIAVTEAEWHKALETGFWSDSKPSRKMTEQERLGVEVESGDNQASPEASLADQIASLAELINDTPEPTTQEQANTLTGRLDKMRALLKLAEAQRVTEKQPFLDGGKAVDAKWQAIGEPGGNAYRDGEARRKAFLRKEQQRLDDEAAAERRRKQAEVDAENERIRAENAKIAAEAAETGKPEAFAPLAEVAAPAVEQPRATAGSAFGRSSGLKKVTVLDKLDGEALAFHFLETQDTDFLAYLTDRAKKAIRAKVTLPGVTTKVELQ